MKKIIISLSVIAIVAVISIGITSAYFSDTETSTDNTMAAGTMDLDINGGDAAVTTMTLTDKAPGDSGSEPSTGSLTLKNSGSLEGELDITMGKCIFQLLVSFLNRPLIARMVDLEWCPLLGCTF